MALTTTQQTVVKAHRGERPGLWYLATPDAVWTVEERRVPAEYGGGWAWYATHRSDDSIYLDPMPTLRDVKRALAA